MMRQSKAAMLFGPKQRRTMAVLMSGFGKRSGNVANGTNSTLLTDAVEKVSKKRL
jgi:hypothetical protein